MYKAGYNPSQPRDSETGRWSETGDGGAFPFSPGKGEGEARARLATARANFKDDEYDDAKIEASLREINNATAEVARLRADRAKQFRARTGQDAPPIPAHLRTTSSTGVKPSTDLNDIALRVLDDMKVDPAQQRKDEARRLAEQGQQRRREGGFEQRVAAATGQSRYYAEREEDKRRGPQPGLTGAVADTAARVARSVRQVANIAANISGIASTSDYSTMGSHLTFIQRDITALRQELGALPSDARRLHREGTKAINRLNTQLRALRTAVATKTGL